MESVGQRLAAAPLCEAPFPHCVVEDIFPEAFYRQIRRHFPSSEEMIPLAETGRATGYDDRFVLELTPGGLSKLPQGKREFWKQMAEWLRSEKFRNMVIAKFAPFVAAQFAKVDQPQFTSDAMLVEDRSSYSLGPHTDRPKKVITLLFYLPEDDSASTFGTSIYVPKSEKLRDIESRHFPFVFFDRVFTAPFLPNRALAFIKSDRSFHGVEPNAGVSVCRNLLILDIRMAKPYADGRNYAALPARKD